MKRITGKIVSILLGVAAIALLGITPAAASATATISASPASGSKTVGTSFNIAIVVDGGGQSFTSFSATVSTTNLTVLSLTKGSSVTQWITQPKLESGVASLSFSGAVSGSATSVTVYTLSVQGTSTGAAAITISNGSVKTTDGYTVTNIFSSSTSGSYTIAAAATTPAPTTTPKTTTPKTTTTPPKTTTTPTPTTTTPTVTTPAPVVPTTTTVVAKITLPDGTAAVGATVSLSSITGTKTTDSEGLALFSSVAPGTYTLSASTPDYFGSKDITITIDSAVNSVALELAKKPISKTVLYEIGGGVAALLAIIIFIIVIVRITRIGKNEPEQTNNIHTPVPPSILPPSQGV